MGPASRSSLEVPPWVSAQAFSQLLAAARQREDTALRLLIAHWGDPTEPGWACALRVDRAADGAITGATVDVDAPPPGWQGSFGQLCDAAAKAVEAMVDLDPPRLEIRGSVRGDAERELFVTRMRNVLPAPDAAVVSI